MTSAPPAVLNALEQYYDTVPRIGARTEDHGPLTLFVREGAGWPFYARPTRGWDGAPATSDDVRRVLARQRELTVPEAFEWVAETNPALREAVEGVGLAVHEYPLMVLGPASPAAVPRPSVGSWAPVIRCCPRRSPCRVWRSPSPVRRPERRARQN